MVDPTEPQVAGEPPKKPVWIACRATPGCQGHQAVILWQHRFDPAGIQGVKIADGSGKAIRYRCLTCNHDFHIQQ